MLVFDSGEANDKSHVMTPIRVVDSTPTSLPSCAYAYGAKVNRFTYHDSEKWERVENVPTFVDKFKFVYWECIINGKTMELASGDKITIDKPITSSPVVKMTARWSIAYDMIRFNVGSDLYCEVLIDKTLNELVYPDINPTLTDDVLQFQGWDVVEGTKLGGILDYVPIVCEDGSGKKEYKLVCENASGSSYPIVCMHDDI